MKIIPLSRLSLSKMSQGRPYLQIPTKGMMLVTDTIYISFLSVLLNHMVNEGTDLGSLILSRGPDIVGVQ